MSTTPRRYANLISRVFDTPLMIQERKLLTLLEVLGPRLGITEFKPSMMEDDDRVETPQAAHFDGILTMNGATFEPRAEGHFVGNGVAVIPVIGTLVQRADWMDAMSGMQSYTGIEQMLGAALDDRHVGEIVMEFDSRGGEVAGAFDSVDRIYEQRGKGKKITAVVSETAASAAYLLASAADEIVVPRTGSVGSIGVVAAHMDYSRAMDKKGVAITYVYAGDKKVDGNPFMPLSQSVKQEWQDEIDAVYKMFVDTVSRNIGASADSLRGTKAGMYSGFKAVDAGLAHRVNSFANELGNAMIRQNTMSGSFRLTLSEKEIAMGKEQEEKAKLEAAEAEKAKAIADANAKAKAESDAKIAADQKAAAEKAALAGTVEGERARIQAIMNCEDAKDRQQMAQHLAFKTTLSETDAIALLAASPKGKTDKLSSAMSNFKPGVPNIGAIENESKPAAVSSTDIYKFRAQQFNGGSKKAA